MLRVDKSAHYFLVEIVKLKTNSIISTSKKTEVVDLSKLLSSMCSCIFSIVTIEQIKSEIDYEY